MRKAVIVHEIKDYLIITFGLFLYAFGWVAFLLPYGIACGGLTGISAIVYYLTNLEMQVTYFTVNFVLVLFAIRILGLKFCIKTIFGFSVLSVILWALQILFKMDNGELPMIIGEGQGFMACVLGGTFCGVGLGIVFMHQGSTGGTDIIAASINKYHDFSLGTILIFADFIIIGSCLFIPQFGTFLERMTMVVFGFCTMIIENFMLDYIMNRQRQSVQFMIFSKKYQEIAKALAMQTDHTMTILDGHGWYSGKEVKVIVLLAKKSESVTIFRIVKMIDPNAFVSQSAVIGVFGEGFDKIKVKVKREHIEKAGMIIDNQDIDTDIKQ